MARTSGRVKLAANAGDKLQQASNVYNKHQELGDASPLNVSTDIHWDITGPKVAEALGKHNEAEAYKNKMEQAYRDRDMMMPEIEETLKNSRILLKALYAKNPKRLGEWGFEVDDSVQATAKATAKTKE